MFQISEKKFIIKKCEEKEIPEKITNILIKFNEYLKYTDINDDVCFELFLWLYLVFKKFNYFPKLLFYNYGKYNSKELETISIKDMDATDIENNYYKMTIYNGAMIFIENLGTIKLGQNIPPYIFNESFNNKKEKEFTILNYTCIKSKSRVLTSAFNNFSDYAAAALLNSSSKKIVINIFIQEKIHFRENEIMDYLKDIDFEFLVKNPDSLNLIN